MVVYSWQLTLVVWLCFLPLFVVARAASSGGLAALRRGPRSGSATMLAAIGGVGRRRRRPSARTACEERTAAPASTPRSSAHRRARGPGPGPRSRSFSAGELVAGLATAAVVVVGRAARRRRASISAGQAARVPVPGAAVRRAGADRPPRCSTRPQNAVAGWRRVIGVLDTPADVGRPGRGGPRSCRAARSTRALRATSASPTPAARPVLRDVDLAIAAAAPGSRSSARPAPARRRSPSCSPG